MKRLRETDFLRWSNAQGIALDRAYPKVAILDFAGDGQDAVRFWEVPPEPERRPFFLATALELAGEWEECYVWRHSGSWPEPSRVHPRRINDAVECEILDGLGVPLGSADVLAFPKESLASLVTLLFSTTVFGWSVGEDLYIVPDTARIIIQTDHHNVVHISFRSERDVRGGVERMDAAGFPLPVELPDETFKPVSWIKPDVP